MNNTIKKTNWLSVWRERVPKIPVAIRWGILALFILLAGAGGYAYYSQVVLPAQASAAQPSLQTATVKQGDIVLSASGTGTLIPLAQSSVGFRSSGQLSVLYVKLGDEVKEGQLLAELDNYNEKAQLDQAERTLKEMTSPYAVSIAEQDVATAQTTLDSATKKLKFIISPEVFYWEEKVAEAEKALQQAQADAQSHPSAEADKIVEKAQTALKSAQSGLRWAQNNYTDEYIPDVFTVTEVDTSTRPPTRKTYVDAPSAAEIAGARATYAADQLAVQQAQDYLMVLNGGDVPENATGSNLQALLTARLNLQTAQANLEARKMYAPIDGTVISVSAILGDSVGSASIITIEDLSQPYQLQVYLDETDWPNIKAGYPVEVTFDILPDQTLTGKVISVDSVLTQSSGASVVRGVVQLDHSIQGVTLPMGASASVEVIGGSAKNAVLVPVSALHQAGPGQYTVFVMEDGKTKLRTVEIGLMDLVNAEVKSGLQPGDVVTTGITVTK